MRERITESNKRRRWIGAIILGAAVAVIYAIVFTATVSPAPDGSFVSICGTVYKDSNCNGAIDGGDTPAAGVTITLYESDGVTPAKDATGAVVPPMTTAADGTYCFKPDATLLFARPFVVTESVPAGSTASNAVPGTGSGGTKQSNTSILVNSTTTGSTYALNDFLICQPSNNVNICGNVYKDVDNSGTINAGDTKFSNVTVELHTPGPDGLFCTADDVTVSTMMTDANGYYCFMGVPAGTYGVHEVVPSGYTAVGSFPGSGSGGTSNGVDCIKVTATTPGTTYTPNDFLIKQTSTPKVNICGTVYNDTNNSGTINAGDTKVANVTVELHNPGPDGLYCTADDVTIATTTTDSYGYYCFMNVAAGTYGVHEVVPAAYNAVGAFPGSGSGGTALAPDCIKVVATTPGTTYQPNDFLLNQSTPKICLTKLVDKTSIKCGGKVNYTYIVTNCGNVCLTNVTVTDDNGTPDFPGDDFTVACIPSLPAGASMTFYACITPCFDMCIPWGSGTKVCGKFITECAPNGDIRCTYRQNRDIHENVYGATCQYTGWTHPHYFSDHCNGDKAEFRFCDSKGNVCVDLDCDYITQCSKTQYPSGYGCQGFGGGDGHQYKGCNYVQECRTSLSDCMNKKSSYWSCNKDTPWTDTQNPDWDYTHGYCVTVHHEAFGSNGFGSCSIPHVKNYHCKSGNDDCYPKPCSTVVTNTACATGMWGKLTVSAKAHATVTCSP